MTVSAERTLRRRLRSSLPDWCEHVLEPQGLAPARHHRLVISALEGLGAAGSRRLMVLMPPGSAKSTYTSMLFPPWWMSRHAGGHVLAVSHTEGLAEHFGRAVRGLIGTHGARLGLRLAGDNRAAGRFSTSTGGTYFACGVHGAITGRRADLAIIDDPVRSVLEAENARARDRLLEWYRSELITRMKPGGCIVLAMTRWHTDDIAGVLMRQGGWQVLRLPALAEADDPLGRAPGAVLWPEWEDAAAIADKREVVGEHAFAAMFQQDPRPPARRFFDVSRMKVVTEPRAGRQVRAWDFAAGTDARFDPDWTVGMLVSADAKGLHCIEDVRRVRVGPGELAGLVAAVAREDGRRVAVSMPQDPGQAGLHQTTYLTNVLAGYAVESSRETGAKTTRAMPVASLLEADGLSMVAAVWNRPLLDEMAAFPGGRKDDQIDALSRACAFLGAGTARSATFRQIAFGER